MQSKCMYPFMFTLYCRGHVNFLLLLSPVFVAGWLPELRCSFQWAYVWLEHTHFSMLDKRTKIKPPFKAKFSDTPHKYRVLSLVRCSRECRKSWRAWWQLPLMEGTWDRSLGQLPITQTLPWRRTPCCPCSSTPSTGQSQFLDLRGA